MADDIILVIDEGTTSTRAIAFDRDLRPVAVAQEALSLSYPDDGWVEQDGEEIWTRTLSVCRQVIESVGGAERIAGIGIANQRETTLIWGRETLRPIAPAIVWQDRRTAKMCAALKANGHENTVSAATGLLLDPYFSATKIGWILDNVPGARAQAKAGELAFGTVETFLIAKLTSGAVHASDMTNASRTLLARLDIEAGRGWDDDMAALFQIPSALLPTIVDSSGVLGETEPTLFGRSIPILSAIGDQQAALVGQGCLGAGEAKITYGTGAFLVANTAKVRPLSRHRLLGTVAYTRGDERAYALEGSIFNAGTVIKWLRDDLGLIADANESAARAEALSDNGGVYFVPAFTGLGAPHWQADARGAISGLSRATGAAHIVRAGLEAAAYQTYDLIEAFKADGAGVSRLRVDGGMAANDWLMQFLADILDMPVERPEDTEMTALGAAVLAAVELGWMRMQDWGKRTPPGHRFTPSMPAAKRTVALAGWQDAMGKI